MMVNIRFPSELLQLSFCTNRMKIVDIDFFHSSNHDHILSPIKLSEHL
jgi:hypothetical protein